MSSLPSKRILYGLFEDEEILLKAVKNARSEGLTIWNCFTPFPVHGLDHAMGIKDTRLHTAGFLFGATGTTVALTFMIWVNAYNYPINFGGKPLISLPSYIPITFELTVLFASVGMVLLYLFINRLAPGMEQPILDPRTTSYLFLMGFEIDDSTTPEQIADVRRVLDENGAVEIAEKTIEEETDGVIRQIF
jgi:hypothetical protein